MTFNYPHTGVFRYNGGVITDLRSPLPDTWYYLGGYVTDDGTIITFAQAQAPTRGRHWTTIEWAPGAIDGRTVNLLPFHSATAQLSGDHLVVQSFPSYDGPDLLNPETYVTDLDGGHPYRLPSPAGTVTQALYPAGDWAYGRYFKPDDKDLEQHAVNVRWDLRDGSYQVVAHEGPANAKGWIVYAIPIGKDHMSFRYVLDKSGTLETLLPPPGFRGRFDASSLADDGTVVGTAALTNDTGDTSADTLVPVIWHC